MGGSRTGKLKYLFLELSWPEYGAMDNGGGGQVHQGLDKDQSGEVTLVASFVKVSLVKAWCNSSSLGLNFLICSKN